MCIRDRVKAPYVYNAAICRMLLNRLRAAEGLRSAIQVVEYALMAQTNRKFFLEQYFFISQKWSPTQWGFLREMLEEQAKLCTPAQREQSHARRQHGFGKHAWALLQEHAAFAIGGVHPIAPGHRSNPPSRENITERATRIASFNKRGTATRKRAHIDVAWCAVGTALVQISDRC